MKKTILFLFAFLLSNGLVGQWMQTNGPQGASVYCLKANGSDLFAGTDDGIYYSSDSGITWQNYNHGLQGTLARSIYISGSNIYFSNDNGIFRSSNNGLTWTPINNGIPISPISAIQEIGNILIASAMYNGLLYRSTDSGQSWLPIQTGAQSIIYTMIQHNSVLYAGTGRGVFYSIDSGSTWIADTNGFSGPAFSLGYSGGKLFVGSLSGYLLVSNSLGSQWSRVNTFVTFRDVYDIVEIGQELFVSTAGDGIFKSTDNGNTWVNIRIGLQAEYVMRVVNLGSKFFAATVRCGIFASSNGGTSWKLSCLGISETISSAITVINDTIYAGAVYCGAFRSTDQAQTWADINNDSMFQNVGVGSPAGNINSFHSFANYIYATTDHGILRSSNGGENWTLLPDSGFETLAHIGAILFGNKNDTVFASSDSGLTWNNLINNFYCIGLRKLKSNGGDLYALGASGLFVLRSGNTIWQQLIHGITDIKDVEFTTSTVLAGSADSLFISSDNGNTWNTVNTAGSFYYNILATPNFVLASTASGIYISFDDGFNWTPSNVGFAYENVRCLATDGQYVYAGTDGNGVWKRSYSSLISVDEVFDESLAILFPNPSDGKFTIHFPENKNGLVRIFNSTGELIYNERKKELEFEIDISNHASGVYYMTIENEKSIITKKIILN